MEQFPSNQETNDAESKDKPQSRFFENDYERDYMLNRADNFIDQIVDQDYQSIVFLDKAARPWAALIRERWKHRFPEESFPDTKFVKIGTELGVQGKTRTFYPFHPTEKDIKDAKKGEYWVVNQNPQELIELKKYWDTRIGELKKVFSADKNFSQAKKVLIADSFTWSGNTLNLALDLFRKAFPDITFEAGAITGNNGEGWFNFPKLSVSPMRNWGSLDTEKKYPSVPGSGDGNGMFIKSHARSIKDIKDQDISIFKKIINRFQGLDEEVLLSDEAREAVSVHKRNQAAEIERYAEFRKEIESMADIGVEEANGHRKEIIQNKMKS